MSTTSNHFRATPTRLRWIAVADAHGLTLLSGNVDAHNQLQLISEAKLKHEEPDREHGRPSPLGDKSGHAYASTHHQDEEDLRRFAQDAAHWLDEQVALNLIHAINIFAPDRLLGALRQHWSASTAAITTDHPLELAALTLDELARHPRIRSCWPV